MLVSLLLTCETLLTDYKAYRTGHVLVQVRLRHRDGRAAAAVNRRRRAAP